MAEQITQTLGFDAGGAIASINALNTALSALSTNLQAVAAGGKAFNAARLSKTFKSLNANSPAKTITNASNAAKSLGNNLNNAAQQGTAGLKTLNNQANQFTISWATLSRIVGTQVLLRGFTAISGAIKDGLTSARELEKRVAEIQTIGGRSGGQFNFAQADITEGLQATAETFGFDILDVAAAKYQEFSNQVQGSKDSLEFQNAAAKLAVATNSSLQDSVNLLSSALNAFGKNASQSEEVAGLLFTTIEQGRVQASELANSLGRVAPLANALGVNFNELGASLARVTQGGTRADTAITQILGIMNKLSKPTGDLKQAFKDLTVASAAQGITESGGLLNFLQAIKKEAGDSTELVGFFNNVRAIQGVLSLLETDLAQTEKVFGELNITTTESKEALNQVFDAVNNTAAKEYERQIARLAGTWRDFASNLVPIINGALSLLNSTLENIANNPFFSSGVLLTATATMGTFAFATTGATASLTAFTGAAAASALVLAPFAAVIVGVGIAATGLAVALKQPSVEFYADLTARATERLNELNDSLAANERELKAQADGLRKTGVEAGKFAGRFSEIRRAAIDSVSELNREFETSSKSALDSILKSRQAITKQIQDAVKTADAQLEKSADRITSIQAKKEDFLLNKRLSNLNDVQKAYGLFEASQQQGNSAADLISGSTDLRDFDAAADVLDRRLALAQRGLQAAESSGNAGVIAQAQQQVVTALNDQVNLEKQRSAIINERRDAAAAIAAQDKAETERLKSLIGEIKKNLSILNDGGQILNPTQLAANEKKVDGLLAKLRDFSLSSDSLDISEVLGIQELAGTFQTELNQGFSAIKIDRERINEEVRQVFADINGLVDDNVIELGISLGFLGTEGFDQLTDLQKIIQNITKDIDNLTGATADYRDQQERVTALQDTFNETLAGTTGPAAFLKQLEQIKDKITNDASTTEEEADRLLTALEGLLNPLARLGTGVDFGGGGDRNDAAVLEATRTAVEALFEARKKLAQLEPAGEENESQLRNIQLLKESVDSNVRQVGALATGIGGVGTETGKVTEETLKTLNAVDGTATGWNAVTQQIKRATAETEKFNNANRATQVPSLSPVNRMFGGPLYRAGGGFARGTDTIPAMLSPGEFVVNARSSQRFASQLTAMNAGVNPTYRAEGGPVNNNTVNVGDINVNGTSNPDDTARLVMSKIRREFRRGTASRF